MAAAADTASWGVGSKLNEALAAWIQRHLYRNDPAMWEECTRYITTGVYPDWPYAGATALEALFQAERIAAIRRFIRLLRSAPDFAQRQFDALVPTAFPRHYPT